MVALPMAHLHQILRTTSNMPKRIRTFHSSSKSLMAVDDSTCSVAVTTHDHYASHTAASYEGNLFYSSESPFTRLLRDEVISSLNLNCLSLKESVCLLDIGGGTGNFTRMVLDHYDHQNNMNTNTNTDRYIHHHIISHQGIVLDPFLEANRDVIASSESRSSGVDIQFIKEEAQIFARGDECRTTENEWMKSFNMCLMKEVVHHFEPKERYEIFRGIHRQLKCNHSSSSQAHMNTLSSDFLIITRPKWNIDYPFYDWKKVRDIWAMNQPGVEDIEEDLRNAGFNRVNHRVVPFKCITTIKKWTDMIQGRLWSTFSHFNDDELSEACQRIRYSYASTVSKDVVDDNDLIEFEERMLFITATAFDH